MGPLKTERFGEAFLAISGQLTQGPPRACPR